MGRALRGGRGGAERGMMLIDVIVGSALMLVIFVGIIGAFQLTLDVVTSNRARAGAIALANERMEYIRSLPYDSIGTVGGIPSGAMAQSETVSLDGITYTRRTVVLFEDDPADGTDVNDENGITADYRAVKVDVSWKSRTGTRDIILVSRVSPPTGLELPPCSNCGTLVIFTVDATGQPLASADVHVVNSAESIDTTIHSNAKGVAMIIGAPAAAGYQVTVSKSGYSSAQTYSPTAQNTNPNPGNLTVANDTTTSATFAIDLVGSKLIKTYTAIRSGTWTDGFSGTSNIATSTNIDVSGGSAQLSGSAPYGSGEVESVTIAPATLASWGTVSASTSAVAGTAIAYHIYDSSGTIIPDSAIPGNSTGVTLPLDLSALSTTTYAGIRLDAVLTGDTDTPAIDSWSVGYTYGPTPLPNIALSVTGTKTIGSGPSGPVLKYTNSTQTDATSQVSLTGLEWDSYTVAVDTATGYDTAAICGLQPEALAPGASMTTSVYLLPHASNTLRVSVVAGSTGNVIQNATVAITGPALATSTTGSCGQAFFSALTAGTYGITVSAPGYIDYTNAALSVSGQTLLPVTLSI